MGGDVHPFYFKVYMTTKLNGQILLHIEQSHLKQLFPGCLCYKDGLNELWYNFTNLWKNENDKDFLEFIVHWYLEANGNSAKIEGSIIIAQVALELIYSG